MNLNRLILKPVITEKSLAQTSFGQFTFYVEPKSRKHQIKTAVEQQFKVHVVAVTTLTGKPTQKRTGRKRLPAQTSMSKKAIVTLKTGESIPVFETQG